MPGRAMMGTSISHYRIIARLPRFLPDGRRLIRTTAPDLIVHDIAGDARRTIWSASPGRTLGPCALSRDGELLVWSETADGSGVWLLSLGS